MRLANLVLACSVLCATHAAGQGVGGAFDPERFVSPPERGQVWLVPPGGGRQPYPTIQAAVDAAAAGDTVLLSDGIFRGPGNRNVYVSGKDLVIRSENGPEGCVLDCEFKGRGFFFEGSGVTSQTFLFGITIINGDVEDGVFSGGSISSWGGGILCLGACPTIDGCVVQGCKASNGGGIYYAGSSGMGPARRRARLLDLGERGKQQWRWNLLPGRRCRTLYDRWECESSHPRRWSLCILATDADDDPKLPDRGQHGPLHLWERRVRRWYPRRWKRHPSSSAVRSSRTWPRPEEGSVSPRIHRRRRTASSGATPRSPANRCTTRPSRASSFRRCVFCDVEGGLAGIASLPILVDPIIVNMIDEDPLFVDEAAGDYHLLAQSPCIDAGEVPTGLVLYEGDIDNQPREIGMRDIGADEYWSGLVLSLISPGRVGMVNGVTASGARPGELVLFFYGVMPGTLPFPFGACPSLALDVVDPILLATPVADADGTASYSQLVPTGFSGSTLYLQVVRFDPQDSSRRL